MTAVVLITFFVLDCVSVGPKQGHHACGSFPTAAECEAHKFAYSKKEGGVIFRCLPIEDLK